MKKHGIHTRTRLYCIMPLFAYAFLKGVGTQVRTLNAFVPTENAGSALS